MHTICYLYSMFSIFANTIKLITSLTNYFMASTQDLKDAAAAEAQQHADAIAAKDAIIVDLQNQLANAPTPESLDEVKVAIEGIVP